MIEQNKLSEEQKLNYEKLKKWLSEAKVVYTKLNHVSRSGMFRLISVYVIIDNEQLQLDYFIDNLEIDKRDKTREGIRVYGCGMDMGFSLVHSLFSAMFGINYDWQKEKSHRWI